MRMLYSHWCFKKGTKPTVIVRQSSHVNMTCQISPSQTVAPTGEDAAPWGHLAMSGDISGCHNWDEGGVAPGI